LTIPPSAALDHVQIAAPHGCESEARRFYGNVIGLTEVDKPEPLRSRGGLWFALDHAQLHIGIETPFTPARKAHPAFRVGDAELSALAERLTEAGASVRWDNELDDTRRFFTEDPWGNRLEFLSR
jgi:catechol 2,3-dioxygenase-like lactoylglutathione lyase family enzyme